MAAISDPKLLDRISSFGALSLEEIKPLPVDKREQVPVLFVDDGEMQMKIAERNLDKLLSNFKEKYKFTYLTAQNGLEAIKYYLIKYKFQLIIMDYDMPVMKGLEALQAWNSLDPDCEKICKTTAIFINTESADVAQKAYKQAKKTDEKFKMNIKVLEKKLCTPLSFKNLLKDNSVIEAE